MINCQQAMNVPTGSIALSQVRNPPQSRKAARSREETPKACAASVGGRGFEWKAGNAPGGRNHLQFCAMRMIGSVRVNDSLRCVMIHHDWPRSLPDRHFRALTARAFNNISHLRTAFQLARAR
jgi:hypothetical protein